MGQRCPPKHFPNRPLLRRNKSVQKRCRLPGDPGDEARGPKKKHSARAARKWSQKGLRVGYPGGQTKYLIWDHFFGPNHPLFCLPISTYRPSISTYGPGGSHKYLLTLRKYLWIVCGRQKAHIITKRFSVPDRFPSPKAPMCPEGKKRASEPIGHICSPGHFPKRTLFGSNRPVPNRCRPPSNKAGGL